MAFDTKMGMKLIKLGLNVQYYRKLKNWTQEQLSEMSGVSIVSIAKLESSNSYANPKIATIFKIAEALDINPKVLFEFRDDN